jgi:hypothetical protein
MSLLAYSAAWRLWRLISAAHWFVPESQHGRELLRRLRADIEELSPTHQASGSDARDEWSANQARLRYLLGVRDPRAFLTWDVICKTMFIPFARYSPIELAFLRQRRDWGRWYSAIAEHRVGLPFPYPLCPSSSANAIHHAYHLALLEDRLGQPVHTFGTICEFGGGYGSTCRIARSLGFSGRYVIFDLPEFSALQRYYLGSVGTDVITTSDPAQLASITERRAAPSLFIATWSLSEAPGTVREQVLQSVSGFDAFLFAFQDRFGEQDNKSYFDSLSSRLGGIRLTTIPIDHLPGNSYVFGWRVRPSEDIPDISSSSSMNASVPRTWPVS